MTTQFHSGQKVREKATGNLGTVTGTDERGSLVVEFAATGNTHGSPWGEYVDTGKTLHVVPQFASRMIEAVVGD